MRPALVLAASVVVHAALITALTATTPSTRSRWSRAADPVPEPDLVVELVTLPVEIAETRAAMEEDAGSRHDRQDRPGSFSQENVHGDRGDPGGSSLASRDDELPEAEEPTRTRSVLAMRRDGDVDLSLPAARIAVIESEPVSGRPSGETGTLAPAGGGTRKSDQGAFTARVAKDGTVDLKDAENFHMEVALPSPEELGDMLQAWYYAPNKPVGTLPPEGMEDVAYDGDVAVTLETVKISDDGPGLAILTGGFDATDALMRRLGGGDPYASKKLQFLDHTRDERAQIGRRHRSEQLAKASQIMRKNLQALWASQASIADKKRALFELWDECAESGSEEVRAAGRDARAQVIGFIRTYLPAGSAEAYTAEELNALTRQKRSISAFQPYE